MTALRVLSWAGAWGRALASAVSEPFSARTGIAVEAVHHVGLALPDALPRAIASGARPPVDVVWCNTSAAIHAARAGLCDPLDALSGHGELASRAAPPGGGWDFVQAYVVHYVLVYRRALYPSSPPSSWEALYRREHAGRVVLYPGGKGFIPVAQVLGGGDIASIPASMSPCWAAIGRLRPQLGRPDYSIGLGPAFERGGIDLCYRALPNALGFETEGLDVGWTAPVEGVADTTDAFFVPRGLDDETRERARRYVAFALSRDVQQRWCDALGVLPMHTGASAPALLRERGLPTHAEDLRGVLHVAPEVEAAHEAAWAAEFDALVGLDGPA